MVILFVGCVDLCMFTAFSILHYGFIPCFENTEKFKENRSSMYFNQLSLFEVSTKVYSFMNSTFAQKRHVIVHYNS